MTDQEDTRRNKNTMVYTSDSDNFSDSDAQSDLENQMTIDYETATTTKRSKVAWSTSRFFKVSLILVLVACCAAAVVLPVVSKGNEKETRQDVEPATSSNEVLGNVDLEPEPETQPNEIAVVETLVESVDEASLSPSNAPSEITVAPSVKPIRSPAITAAPVPSIAPSPAPTGPMSTDTPTVSDNTPFPTTAEGIRRNTAAPTTPPPTLDSTVTVTSPTTPSPTFAETSVLTTFASSLTETPISTTPSSVPSHIGDETPASTIFPTIAPMETNSSSTPTEPQPTPYPTTAFPTYAPTLNFAPMTAEMKQLQTALLPITRNPDTLSDRGSPEFLAMKWLHDMTTHGSSTLSVQNLINNRNRLQQRFAMAVLDISVQGRGRRTPQFARNSLDECSWIGVSCSNGKVVKIVWVGDRSLQGNLPKDLGLLTGLNHLDLAENNIERTLPTGLYNLTSLRYLYLQDNRLTGPISEDISKLNQLEKLYLGDNQLTGTFPRGLGSKALGGGNARQLKFLHLGRNKLSGPIPDNLNLRNLYYLDMSHNNFSGEIPVDWYEGGNTFYWLRHLYLNNNGLSGEIPSTFPRIGNGRLMQLDVSYNNFSGVFPGNWVPRNMLEALEIQGNNFSSLDEQLCMLSVFNGGEMTALRSDCVICTCGLPYCRTPRCS